MEAVNHSCLPQQATATFAFCISLYIFLLSNFFFYIGSKFVFHLPLLVLFLYHPVFALVHILKVFSIVHTRIHLSWGFTLQNAY